MGCITALIMVAMKSERIQINEAFGIPHSQNFMNIGCSKIYIFETGIGMVHASSAIANALHSITPDFVINTGCAGAHSPTLEKGDVVIGSEYVPLSNIIVHPNKTIEHDGVRVGDNKIHSYKANDVLLKIASTLQAKNIGKIGS